tara:strand:+ start:162 stop:947 length:786 start_codon:yes stop_codon:yes gene_type:complete
MDYIIAIPTYKRSQSISQKTLKVLKRHRIPKEKIYLFVANNNEKKEYQTNVPNKYYGQLIVGRLGLKNQRNFINKYFPEGQYIVEMDDDIESILQIENKEDPTNRIYNNLVNIKGLNNFFKRTFKILKKNNLYLWGIYPVANGYFMTPTITYDLKFIVGPLWGMINRHYPDLQQTINEKENVERTLQFYQRDQGLIRFNFITIKTSYYRNPGGMQYENKNRKKESLNSAHYLVKKFPQYATLYLKKKSGYAEVKLRDKRKK